MSIPRKGGVCKGTLPCHILKQNNIFFYVAHSRMFILLPLQGTIESWELRIERRKKENFFFCT